LAQPSRYTSNDAARLTFRVSREQKRVAFVSRARTARELHAIVSHVFELDQTKHTLGLAQMRRRSVVLALVHSIRHDREENPT
jgi:hypothetical protein